MLDPPATVVINPVVAVTLRIRYPSYSVKYKSPRVLSHNCKGVANEVDVAGTPSECVSPTGMLPSPA